MKASKEYHAVAARDSKIRLDKPFAEIQKTEKVSAEAIRQRKSQRTADEKCERLRAMAKRRRVAGMEGLAAEATRKSSRRK